MIWLSTCKHCHNLYVILYLLLHSFKEILPPYMADFVIFKKKLNLFIFYCILPAFSEYRIEISLRHSETSLIAGSNPQSREGLTPIFIENRIFCKNGHQILIFYPILKNNSSFFLCELLVEEINTKVCISGKNHPKR